MKRILALLVALAMLFSLTACRGDDENPASTGTSTNDTGTNLNGYEGELPEAVFGTWYPNPEVSNIPIEIKSDGTCSINDQTLAWNIESVENDSVVIVAGDNGDYYLTFTYLSSALPILSESSFGMSIKHLKMWEYLTQWYNEETGNAFVLDLEELAQVNCNILFDDDSMTIEALDGENITHTIHFVDSQATVTDASGNSTVYLPIGGGHGIDLSDPQAVYAQAMDNLQRILSAGNSTIYVDGSGEFRMSDSAALERVYTTLVSLQNYMDVSDQLNCIRKVDNILLSLDRVVDGVSTTDMECDYNSYGSRSSRWDVEEAISSGTQIYSYYNGSGGTHSIEVWGLVKGGPVYGADGKLSALTVTSSSTREKFTAPVTCDEKGNVIRIEVPFVEDAVYGIDRALSQVYEFLYDSNGRLIQFTKTQHSKNGTYETTQFYEEYGFYYKSITECYYDDAGKLTDTIEHHVEIGPHGIDNWYYSPSQFLYNSDGLLSARVVTMGHIQRSGLTREEQETLNGIQHSLFTSKGFADSVDNSLVAKLGNVLSDVKEIARYEYNYGSIYVYTPEG